MKYVNVGTIGHIDHGKNNLKSLIYIAMKSIEGEHKMNVKSKVNYFDVKEGDIVEVVEFVKAHTEERKDGDHIEQKLDIYKVVLPNSTKVHYLYNFEVKK